MSTQIFYFIYLIHYIYVGLFRPIHVYCRLLVVCVVPDLPFFIYQVPSYSCAPPPPLQNMFRRLWARERGTPISLHYMYVPL